MRSDDWSPRGRIETDYRNAIQGIIDKVLARVHEDIAVSGMVSPYDVTGMIRKYFTSDTYRAYAFAAARRMITGLFHDGAITWREAARQSMRGREIYRALQNELKGPVGFRLQTLIEQNAELIRTFPLSIAKRANSFIEAESLKGRRATAIAGDLVAQFPEISKARLSLIARTEVSKASTELTRARAEHAGIDWYEWRISKDTRVRDSHRILDRVLVSWSDPPSPEELAKIKSSLGHYNAGGAPNCRCYPAPLVDVDDVPWPHKVYYAGSIRHMTRAAFTSVAGGAHAAAA